MANKSVYFVNTHAARHDLLGVVAYLKEAAEQEAEFTRFYMIKGGQWAGQVEFQHEVRSVTFDPDMPAWWLLSKRGVVMSLTASGTGEEVIADAGTGPDKLGYVNAIRRIGGEVFVCGYRRQVYQRVGNGWKHIDAGILLPKSEKARGFQDLTGTSEKDLYAFGRKGEICQYDGTKWTEIDSPTGVTLESGCCSEDGTVYLCGDKGTVVVGRGGNWQVMIDDGFNENLWSIVEYDGKIIAAHRRGLVEITPDGFTPIEMPRESPTTSRLAVAGKTLWSVGNYDIFSLDSSGWADYPCPDNQ